MKSSILAKDIHSIFGGCGNGREETGSLRIICGNCNKIGNYSYYLHNEDDSCVPKLCTYCGNKFEYESLENES